MLLVGPGTFSFALGRDKLRFVLHRSLWVGPWFAGRLVCPALTDVSLAAGVDEARFRHENACP